MANKRVDLLEDQLGEQEDGVIGLRFAFIALARALDEQGVLPRQALARHLAQTAADLRAGSIPGDPGDLSPAAEQVDSLRDAVSRPR